MASGTIDGKKGDRADEEVDVHGVADWLCTAPGGAHEIGG